MPASLAPEDCAEILNTTQPILSKGKAVPAVQTTQDYVAVRTILNRGAIMEDEAGANIKVNVVYHKPANARNVGLFWRERYNQQDGVLSGTAEWRSTTSGAVADTLQVAANSGSETKILDFSAKLDMQMWHDWYEQMEDNFWEGPSDESDPQTPWGLFNYWLKYSASTGFNGGNHTNWSGGQLGLSRTTYPELAHYTAQYTDITQADLLDTTDTALIKSAFIPPAPDPISGYGDGQTKDAGLYCELATVQAVRRYLEGNNDDLGTDTSPIEGAHTRQVPWIWAPKIESEHSTSKPIVGIKWPFFSIRHLPGMWMQKTTWHKDNSRPSTIKKDLMCHGYNFVFEDPRQGLMLIAKSDPLND
jgi:hypothetical protein